MDSPPDGASGRVWQAAGATIILDRPRIMGVLNVTPDSFSDGGRDLDLDRAVDRAIGMVEAGADIIDVGGESTRPGAAPVPAEQELRRVLPVVERLADLAVTISVDTMKSEVATAALRGGASIVNDVTGGRDPRMREVAAETSAGFVVMHMRGDPRTMASQTDYEDVVGQVSDEILQSVDLLLEAGCPRSALVIDPGIGFAKTAEQSMRLIRATGTLCKLGLPVLIGPSRKSFISEAGGGQRPGDRLAGTLAACVLGLAWGARIFRVHDVGEARKALDTAQAILATGEVSHRVGTSG